MKGRLAPRGAMDGAPGCVLRPVVALDIDGTLGYYHEHFAKYAMEVWGYSAAHEWRLDAWDGSVPFWHLFGCSKERYRDMKLGYRQGRLKRSMPVVAGAAELTRAVRAAGAEVWVCTTRPYLRLDNIDPDTRHWLRRNGIQYDGVLFGESKYRDLAKLVGSNRVVAVLDDDKTQVATARRHKLSAFLIARKYNECEEFFRMPDLEIATKNILSLVSVWREGEEV